MKESMPIYQYKCTKCEFIFELKQDFNSPNTIRCPQCEGKSKRVILPSAVHFKGSGFYSTDHKPDTRVRGESGKLGRRVSETDRSNIDAETPTRTDSKGRPLVTPTRPRPAGRGS